METPQLYVEDQVEMCDGHSDYGYSILYCNHAGEKIEVYRTSYETNRMNEQTEGILSFDLERSGKGWIVTLQLVGSREKLQSKDGKDWRSVSA